ncbi:MAG: tetratricopeptide repeat protein, partial [Chloroflexi bacterium]|nr:tetratricopeptide repeat protein [Chloroflexota bacterium]
MSKVSVEAQGMKNRSYITCLLLPALILMLFAGCSFFKSGSHKSQAQTQDDWRLKHPRGSEYYALFEEAMKLQEDGKSVEALKKAEKVVQMVPDDIGHDLQMLMGSLYINTGQPKKAEKYVNMLIENNPDDPVALDMKVNMLCNLLEYDEAKRTAEKILKLPRAPKNIKLGAYLAMGYSAFMREHKYDEAEKYFQGFQVV